MEAHSGSSLRIGPAGWSYRDWQGIVYPAGAGRDFDPLAWIARFFDFVEINVSFYRVPSAQQAADWVRRVADTDLHFSAKIPREFTHRGAPVTPAAIRAFREFLGPLAEAERLDVVLAQFPWSMRPTPQAIGLFDALRVAVAPHPVVHEVRHADWSDPRWVQRLQADGLDLVHVDQPVLPRNLGPDFGPGERAYVRLHGRNAANWFDARAGRDARYDWLYSLEDLRQWSQRVRALHASRGTVHVVTNNHFQGQAVVNALEIGALLGRPAREVPASLFAHFAGLRERWKSIEFTPQPVEVTASRPSKASRPRQGDLFD